MPRLEPRQRVCQNTGRARPPDGPLGDRPLPEGGYAKGGTSLKICGITDAAFAVEAARRGVDYLGLIFAAKSPRCVTVERAREIVAAVAAEGCGKALSPNDESFLAKSQSVFQNSFGKSAVGRDRRARRFNADRPAVGPYRTISEISMKERDCSAEISSSRGGESFATPEAESRPRTTQPRFVGVFVEQDAAEILKIAKAVPLDVIQLHRAASAEEISALKAEGFEVWRLAGAGDDAFAGEDAVLLDGRDGARTGGTGRRADWSRVAELKRAGRRVVLAGGLSTANIAKAAATGADILDVNSALEISPGRKSLPRLDELLAASTDFRGNR